MQTKETYQGWTNYATWRINLELFSGYELEEEQKQLSTYDLSEFLRESAEYLVTETQSNSQLCESYALAFLAQVNYYEIAEHLKDE
jgi:uncharacterized protein YfdQ (DUF2303 family)